MVAIVFCVARANHLPSAESVPFVAAVVIVPGIKSTGTYYPGVGRHWIGKERCIFYGIWIATTVLWSWQYELLTLIDGKFDDLKHLSAQCILDRLISIITILLQWAINRKVWWHIVRFTSLIVMTITFEAFNCWTCMWRKRRVIYERRIVVATLE